MGPSRIFILRPVATALFMVAIVLAGLVGFHFLSLSALPEVDYPTIQVTHALSGRQPRGDEPDGDRAAGAPVRRDAGAVADGLDQLGGRLGRSRCNSGSASARRRRAGGAGRDQRGAALLPADLPAPPVYAKINPADAPVLTIAITSKTMPLTQVQSIVDTRLAQKISQISGVGLVTLAGGQTPAMRIRADTQALSSYGLSLAQLRTAIDNANANSAKGSFDGPNRAYQINANDQLETVDDYKKLIIAYANNAPVRLSDVAQVVEGAENARLGALAEQDAGDHPQRPAPARRQRHRRRSTDQGAAARAAEEPARGPARHDAVRSHHRHSCVGPRRRVRAGARGRARRAGDLLLPPFGARDAGGGDGGADQPRRHLRGDVPARLQPRQPLADGADDRDGLRRRRRDRDDREYPAPHRGGHRAVRRGAEGRGRDRLHDHLADRLADRGADPAAVHGRHRRPAVPRVRGDAGGDDPDLGGGVADADADAVGALAQAPRGREAEPRRAALGGDVRRGSSIVTSAGSTSCSRGAAPRWSSRS